MFGGQADCHALSSGDQAHVRQRRTQAKEILVGKGIHHGDAHPLVLERRDSSANGISAQSHSPVVDQAYLAMALRLYHAHQVGIGHGGEGMVLHAALTQQHVANEQMALEDPAAVVGKRRCGDREIATDGVHQRFGHGADIALGRAVKGRAVLEVDLARALCGETAPGRQRLLDGIGWRNGALIERDHHGVHIGLDGPGRHTDGLNPPHAGAHQVVRQIACAREIICNAAQQQGHDTLLGSSMPGKILITALWSSFAKPAVEACMNIWCAVEDSGSGNLLERAMSSTKPRSFTKISTADSGVWSPASTWAMRFSNIQLLPALCVMTSYKASASTPSRSPSAMASAAAAVCTPASNWLMTLTLLPEPAQLPRRYTLPAMALSTSSALA